MAILYNENQLKTELFNKFRNVCFEAAMMDLAKKSNPLAKSIPSGRSKQIFSLVHGVLESISGYDALLKALESDNTTIAQKLYLNRLDNICTKIATEASERVMKNVKNEDRIEKNSAKDNVEKTNKNHDDYVKNAKLSDVELTEFKKSIKDIDNDSIGEIIEEKVLSVVKSERYAQLQDEMLKNKLKDELDIIQQSENHVDDMGEQLENNTDFDMDHDISDLEGHIGDDIETENTPAISDETKQAIDSYLGRLPQNYVLEPTSLFSTLLEKSYEALLGVNDKNVLYRTSAVKVATEAIGGTIVKESFSPSMTISDMMKVIVRNIEDFHGVNNSIAKESMNNSNVMDEALSVTVDMYSTLEAFYSIGLLEPDMNALKGFVNQNTEWSKTKGFVATTESMKPVTTQKETFDEIYNQVITCSKKMNVELGRCNDIRAVESYYNNAKGLLGDLETIENVNDDMLAFACESMRDVMKTAVEKNDYLFDTQVHKTINSSDDDYIVTFTAIENYGTKLMSNGLVDKVRVRSMGIDNVVMEGIGSRGNLVSKYTVPTKYNYKERNYTQMEYVEHVMEHVGLSNEKEIMLG